jgi:hypothetical protein
VKNWEITQFGSSILPRIVYVRYKDVNETLSATYQDDIILDTTAPTGTVEILSGSTASQIVVPSNPLITTSPDASFFAYVPSLHCSAGCAPSVPVENPGEDPVEFTVTVRLTAQDDVSGVASAQLSASSDFANMRQVPYTGVPITTQWQVAGSEQTLYLRFIDNAGNVSQTISQPLAP